MPRVDKIEFARLTGERPRPAGANARLGPHGQAVSPPVALITLDDGSTGFGWARVIEADAREVIGIDFDALFDPESRLVRPEWRAWDFALWDLAAKRAAKPVCALVAPSPVARPLCVPCYDTSLYFDDLHIGSDEQAADLIGAQAAEGVDRGHTAFKIKIGRGAMHMELDAGMRRDVSVVHAVRRVVSPTGRIMVDANNGLNHNLACRILAETAEANLYWLEEAFHEDPVVYQALRLWMRENAIATFIADGEGLASPSIEAWAADGAIDVLQYDLRGRTFSGWIECGARFDAAGIRSAPHNYGDPLANFYAAHLAPAIARFEMVEWDEATVDGISAPGFSIRDGAVAVPDTPGFGLEPDLVHFRRAVADAGFVVRR
ncbi:MAG: mandelate racemase [Spirochaetaceae bacterium]|nr:MAG: mandelate racemase [Spirochaetaceae bacterium]